MAAAITNLLLSLPQERNQDYVFAAYFLICTASLLKIRWMTGCVVLSLPLVVLSIVGGRWNTGHLPKDAGVQLVVAWASGALMSYLADSYRRYCPSPVLCHCVSRVVFSEWCGSLS